MRLLVCGGRDFSDKYFIYRTLDRVHAHRPIDVLIEGGANGADRHARNWALLHEIPVETYEADWDNLGKKAGIVRNAEMLKVGKPDGVVAFPGGKGTNNMRDIAKQAKIPVWRPHSLVAAFVELNTNSVN